MKRSVKLERPRCGAPRGTLNKCPESGLSRRDACRTHRRGRLCYIDQRFPRTAAVSAEWSSSDSSAKPKEAPNHRPASRIPRLEARETTQARCLSYFVQRFPNRPTSLAQPVNSRPPVHCLLYFAVMPA